mmetsp:Transcript_5275/g.9431  ORF Transcript_5275/g.9431 Transcript_5275/m.9431 type:complete len:205 (+) Transcript_5275:478-1092(+)
METRSWPTGLLACGSSWAQNRVTCTPSTEMATLPTSRMRPICRSVTGPPASFTCMTRSYPTASIVKRETSSWPPWICTCPNIQTQPSSLAPAHTTLMAVTGASRRFRGPGEACQSDMHNTDCSTSRIPQGTHIARPPVVHWDMHHPLIPPPTSAGTAGGIWRSYGTGCWGISQQGGSDQGTSYLTRSPSSYFAQTYTSTATSGS